MAGIIENFKLDMADDLNITFEEASEVVSLIVNMTVEQSKGRVGRRHIIDTYSRLIEVNRKVAEETFLETLKKKEEAKAWVEAKKQERKDRAFERSRMGLEAFLRKHGNK